MDEGLVNALKYLKKYYFKKPLIIVSAPGRVDFLNTHQDYKGLPVIPIAINLRTYIMVLGYSNDFKVESINLREMDEEYIDIFNPYSFEITRERWFGNYFRAVVSALKKFFKLKELKGIHVVVYSDIPIGSGLASSAALEVAFTKTLDIIYDLKLKLKDIAEISYIAEHDEYGIPCGRLDQYSSTFGDIIRLETRPPYNVQKISYREFKIIVVDSGIRHSTGAIHPVRQQEIDSALRKLMTYGGLPHYLCDKLGYRYDEPKWEDIGEEEIQPYLSILSENEAKRIIFTIKMNKYTEIAVKIMLDKASISELRQFFNEKLLKEVLRKTDWKNILLGFIVNKQHEFLRDLYEVSLPEIERIRDHILALKPYGVKISGAGMGGSLLVISKEHSSKIIDVALKAGASQAWNVEIDDGVKVHST